MLVALSAVILIVLVVWLLPELWVRLCQRRPLHVGGPAQVALTFDDGPEPQTTPLVLDALAELGLKATFFVLGERAAAHPELLRRMAEDPQSDAEKVLSRLPCRQVLIKEGVPGIEPLDDWIDNQDVMQLLHISPRTLQTLRSNGTLPFSRIGNKLYYRRSDIQHVLSQHYLMSKIHSYGKGKR